MILDLLDRILEEDYVMPERWPQPLGEAGYSGERRLMGAVLIDAIILAVNGNDVQEAKDWIFSDARGFLTYVDVCEVCGLDPQWLRVGVSRVLARGKRIRISRYPTDSTNRWIRWRAKQKRLRAA